MKRYILLLVLAFSSVLAFAQNDSTLVWSIQSKHIDSNKYEFTATTTVDPGWYVYGINTAVDGLDPVKFSFGYTHVKPTGSAQYNKPAITEKDPLFENKKLNVYTGTVQVTQQVVIDSIVPANLKVTVSANIGKPGSFIPQPDTSFVVALEGGVDVTADAKRIKIPTLDISKPLSNYGKSTEVKGSLFAIFIIGFLGGFIALLTPCVFPMIPVTVSFFTKRSSTRRQAIRNGVLYGFFIFLIYVLVSVPFHLLNLNKDVLNSISTNAGLNVFFFVVFLFFSISFFGYFEITLPGGLANKADSQAGLGTVGGIFFMALTLTIVSFSCTGPILGSLLAGTVSGGAWPLTAGLAGFGLALALPFAVFAIFPDLLKALPKSGGWLDTVKKFLAFVELALAFKFLSNADLVMHWGILKREIFIAVWVVTGIGLVLYLLGVLHLPHDDREKKISAGRKIVAAIVAVFVVYISPGVTPTKYANLKLLSGFPPPLSYSVYGKENIIGKGLEANVVNDYNKALQLAKQQHKPIMIDFTGWACVNCRKMEENVWTEPEVYKFIKNNYILVSLYVDDRKKLPVLEQLPDYKTSDGEGREIITNGDKWSTFELENIKQEAQPYYVLLDDNERLLNNPVAYTPDAGDYLKWLQNGKQTFDKQP